MLQDSEGAVKFAVIGGGAWGTALAVAMARSSPVSLYSANSDLVSSIEIHRENRRYLPGVALQEEIQVTTSLRSALDGADGVVMAVPTKGLRRTIEECESVLKASSAYLITCKGFESRSGSLPFQILESIVPKASYAVLSGPSFAKDVGEKKPTLVSLAAGDRSVSDTFADALFEGGVRTYFNHDVIGVSVGGATKNVIAIAAGMGSALGIGASAVAALVTRGLSEISRLGVALGAERETFMGLSGMGDLSLTCFSDLSRNRRLGHSLGSGCSLFEAEEALGQVAEGVNAANEVKILADRLGVEMPISVAVSKVLTAEISPDEAARQLYARTLRSEVN